MVDLVQRAEQFAVAAHGATGQQRKYTGEPYVRHCDAVVAILHDAGIRDPHVLAAAWLHDVLEDTKIRFGLLEVEFGRRVAELVAMVTDVSKPSDGNRAVRKEIDRQHLAKSSGDAASIKLADIIDNTRSITRHDPDFAPVYLREKWAVLEILRHGDAGLHRDASRIVYEGIRGAMMTLNPATLRLIRDAIRAIDNEWGAGRAPGDVITHVMACQRELEKAERLLKAKESANG